jgi:hypothetical protein
MVETTTVLRRNDRVEYRSLGDGEGGVLLHLDTAAYHGVNEVGALVWNLLDGITFGALLNELKTRLEQLPDTFEQEIAQFLGELAERDLVLLGAEDEPGA